MMSAPIALWVSMLFSGVKVWREPSMWDENVTPLPSLANFLIGARENTWNPPLSVSIGLSQEMNLCRPPTALNVSSPGRRYRWYVLPSIISAPISSFRSLWYTPLTDPTVPTGMNMGVCISPWSVVMTPHLADD